MTSMHSRPYDRVVSPLHVWLRPVSASPATLSIEAAAARASRCPHPKAARLSELDVHQPRWRDKTPPIKSPGPPSLAGISNQPSSPPRTRSGHLHWYSYS
ncbi:hypothetical protein VPH35_039072 [Triticum aestivum]|uniref:Uncharacterized protein n=1 Tax=Aegilops tauschii subsp. strangulata TaxID=200361 RepID=A0A453CMW2_AEGTS